MDLRGEAWVHLYEFGIGDEPTGGDWEPLSSAELTRAGCICDPGRRHRFVARRATLHRILSGYPTRVCFNASHSGNLAAVAVASRPVGVDVEVDAPRRSLERIAQRMFAADERDLLDRAGDVARRRLFHRCWVAKEAYAKGLGRGLALRFDSFSVASALRSPEGTGRVEGDWTVAVRTRGDTHVAVAAMGDDWEVTSVG